MITPLKFHPDTLKLTFQHLMKKFFIGDNAHAIDDSPCTLLLTLLHAVVKSRNHGTKICKIAIFRIEL
jgi:hypothetical protein